MSTLVALGILHLQTTQEGLAMVQIGVAGKQAYTTVRPLDSRLASCLESARHEPLTRFDQHPSCGLYEPGTRDP